MYDKDYKERFYIIFYLADAEVLWNLKKYISQCVQQFCKNVEMETERKFSSLHFSS